MRTIISICLATCGGAILLAAPAAAQQARLECDTGSQYAVVMNGLDDNFGPQVDPLPAPDPDILAAGQANPNWPTPTSVNKYDATTSNYVLVDTLRLTFPPGKGLEVKKARLTSRFQAIGGPVSNDWLHLRYEDTARRLTYSPVAGYFQLDFVPGAPTPGKALGPGASLGSQPFLDALTTDRRLNLYLQDDTAIDFVKLEYCWGGKRTKEEVPGPDYKIHMPANIPISLSNPNNFIRTHIRSDLGPMPAQAPVEVLFLIRAKRITALPGPYNSQAPEWKCMIQSPGPKTGAKQPNGATVWANESVQEATCIYTPQTTIPVNQYGSWLNLPITLAPNQSVNSQIITVYGWIKSPIQGGSHPNSYSFTSVTP